MWIGDDQKEERLFLISMDKQGARTNARTRSFQEIGTVTGCKEQVNGNHQSFPRAASAASQRDYVVSALADYPFILKSTKTRLRDSLSIVTKLADKNRRECRTSDGALHGHEA